MKQDYYDKLEVSPDCTDEQIKESYRILAKMYHPDNHANSADNVKKMAGRKFNEIREAYKTLSDASLRMKYDQKRLNGLLDYEDEHYDEDYDETYDYQQDGYAEVDGYGNAYNNDELNDAISDFRKGMPRAVKVAAVFVGVLGWIMFISLAVGSRGSIYPEEQPHVDFGISILMEQNDDLRRQLQQSANRSLWLELFYEEQINALNIEIAAAQDMQRYLEQLLQLEDWRETYAQKIDDLLTDLFWANLRLNLLVDSIRHHIDWLEAIREKLDDILFMRGYHDEELIELQQWILGLLGRMQELYVGTIGWDLD